MKQILDYQVVEKNMRTIKFRGWNGRSMVYQPALEVEYSGDVVWEFGNLMQFTGLHDKSGKEIYEGDIVRHKLPEYKPNFYTEPPLTTHGIHEIKWIDELACYSFYDLEYEEVEIIGNIYENPELSNCGEKVDE